MDERHRLDTAQAGTGQRVDQRHLAVGGDRVLVLQAVPGPDLTQADPPRKLGHLPSLSWPVRVALLVERSHPLGPIPAEGGRTPARIFDLQSGRQWDVEAEPHGLFRVAYADRGVAADGRRDLEGRRPVVS